jgi:hypothetical protein
MHGGLYYSAVNYYTRGWVYPRRRIREPFPRRRYDNPIVLFPPPGPPPFSPVGVMYVDALNPAFSGAEVVQSGLSGFEAVLL